MKKSIKATLFIIAISLSSISAKEKVETKKDLPIVSNGEKEFIINSSSNTITSNNREEIILWEEDFESGENGWSFSSGWELTTSSYNSESHSALSPDNVANMDNVHNLLTPAISLPQLGEGETMNFGFWLWDDQPGSSQVDDPSTPDDESTYLADYYSISVLDLDALAWHASGSDVSMSYDGNSYWCGDEDLGGYLDSWIQFLDTPSFTVPSGGTLRADMMWSIESDAGASVGGSCTDGWDAANVRISADNGETWDLLQPGGLGNAYDFECGYGWIWNDDEYDTGGSLNHLAAGWGNTKDWTNIPFDLSSYAGQDVIVRFAFGSDPAYCTLDDSGITGLRVDNITVSGVLDCTPENNCDVSINGEVWVDQFYDYGSCDDDRPGCSGEGWEEYVPGLAFNGNVFMDISTFAGKDVVFRFQSRYDDTQTTGQGNGLHIDDFKIYKISGGNYPAPVGLSAEPGDGEAMLEWNDMNASGQSAFIFDNDAVSNGIQMSTEGATAWAGEMINLAGSSTVNEIHIYNLNAAGTAITIGGFGAIGTLISNEPTYTENVVLDVENGWNIFQVDWDFQNGYIVGHQFTFDILAGLDESAVPSTNSKVLFSGGGWDDWSVAGATIGDGEWGIRALITAEGANVSYNIYRDGDLAASGLNSNMYTDSGLTNNTTYEYTVSATYSDGEESGESDPVTVTPFANSVHEEGIDDGSFESTFNSGSGNFSAVRYTAASSGEDLVRFKWFQVGSGGAFYIKVFEDDGGMPGAEIYSAVQASGNTDGWNEKDLSAQGINVSGDFWVGTKEFSSSAPFGLDTSSDSGNSYSSVGSSGAWTPVSGNLGYHVFLDCGDSCGDTSCNVGDVNGDDGYNILDIVQLANCVLANSCSGCEGDVNSDGGYNILDIVQLANCVLAQSCGGRINDASEAYLIMDDNMVSIDSDGFIGGIQMTLSHSDNFSIKMTENALFADYLTTGNETRLIVVSPENSIIFDYSGSFEIVDIIVANSHSEIDVVMPNVFGLSAAYPNPFNPTTSINLYIPIESDINVQVYDLSGRSVSTLLSGLQSRGNYNLTWDASDHASGMYLVRAENVDAISVQKILLLK
tara:strand:+ start:1541 stop:4801 length:3261 start_codon:yes stop_codon:yes gene_type:complete